MDDKYSDLAFRVAKEISQSDGITMFVYKYLPYGVYISVPDVIRSSTTIRVCEVRPRGVGK